MIFSIPNQPVTTTVADFNTGQTKGITSSLIQCFQYFSLILIVFSGLQYSFAGGYSEGNKGDSCFSSHLYSQDRSAETNIKQPNNDTKLLP